jgi:hypothetical protein
VAERFERYGGVEGFGVLRYAQDDGKKQTTTTARTNKRYRRKQAKGDCEANTCSDGYKYNLEKLQMQQNRLQKNDCFPLKEVRFNLTARNEQSPGG